MNDDLYFAIHFIRMEYPEGFKDLVALAKKSPVHVVNGRGIWDCYCRAAMIGKNLSDAEILFLARLLKKYLDYDYVKKTKGEDWQNNVKKFLTGRLPRIKDENIQLAVSSLLNSLFYLTATLKGGARFFEKKSIFARLDELTKTKNSTHELMEELVEDPDVSGIRYAKAILWLQYTGRARDLAPPTRHLKSFLNNDVGPYYQFYEDDEYFMKRADEMKEDFSACLMDIYRSIFLYRTFKSMLPRGSKFTPKKLVEFMKKKKLAINSIQLALSDIDERESLFEDICKFMGYASPQ